MLLSKNNGKRPANSRRVKLWNLAGCCQDQNADLLLEHSYKEETKESANVDPHLVPQLHHALKSQVHQSWPTFTKILEPTSQLFVSFR